MSTATIEKEVETLTAELELIEEQKNREAKIKAQIRERNAVLAENAKREAIKKARPLEKKAVGLLGEVVKKTQELSDAIEKLDKVYDEIKALGVMPNRHEVLRELRQAIVQSLRLWKWRHPKLFKK